MGRLRSLRHAKPTRGGFPLLRSPITPWTQTGGKRSSTTSGHPSVKHTGGYTFCALASWIMLKPYLDLTQHRSTTQGRPSIDYRSLLRWLVQMQGAEIELGGFRGRTNKLVDGCYSWWVGGCFALLASQGIGGGGGGHAHDAAAHDTTVPADGAWDDDVDGEHLTF
ncbi:terpenoid cyclases/protein prenyltransferase alpha-alpha toroid [Butyriboletus roseoflavus]|nr:terpenoid cyclases/protein prenyltransferase alpha-alpha toroid [Butyriboletus roseoflavus]